MAWTSRSKRVIVAASTTSLCRIASATACEVVDQVAGGAALDEDRQRPGRDHQVRAEHGVDLAGEVVEQGAAGDIDLDGELVHREAVEAPALVGEPLGCVDDAELGAPATATRNCTIGHAVQFCTLGLRCKLGRGDLRQATTSTGEAATSRRTLGPGSSFSASTLASWATTSVPSASVQVTRDSGPRNITVVTVAGPSGSAITETASGRTRAWPGAGRRPGEHRDVAAEDRGDTVPDLRGQPVAEADELADELRRGRGVELGRRRELLQAPGVHDADPVGDGQRLLLVVGDEQRGGADLDLDPADLVAQLHAHLGVEGRERLVEEEDRRLDRQRPGEGHPLLLAAGELVGVAVGVLAEPDQVEHVAGPLAAGGAVATAQLEAEGDVVDARSGAGRGCRPGRPSPCRACWRAPG